jgi:transposase
MPYGVHPEEERQDRRIATRYDKLAANYLALIRLAAIRICCAGQ